VRGHERSHTELALILLLPFLQAPMTEQLQVQEALQGKWQLVYTSVEAFRSSPFFWAFQEGLVGSDQIARCGATFMHACSLARCGRIARCVRRCSAMRA
jgi:hypothetical protein